MDTHIYQGYEIPTYYDSLLAKIIAYGSNRQETIKIMKRALGELHIAPIKTTTAFHLKVLSHPAFLKGDISTHFIQEFINIEPKEVTQAE